MQQATELKDDRLFRWFRRFRYAMCVSHTTAPPFPPPPQSLPSSRSSNSEERNSDTSLAWICGQ